MFGILKGSILTMLRQSTKDTTSEKSTALSILFFTSNVPMAVITISSIEELLSKESIVLRLNFVKLWETEIMSGSRGSLSEKKVTFVGFVRF